jgi:hypothetical protein
MCAVGVFQKRVGLWDTGAHVVAIATEIRDVDLAQQVGHHVGHGRRECDDQARDDSKIRPDKKAVIGCNASTGAP